jgi:hypothetical protein
MEKKRSIDRLFSVFDLPNREEWRLSENTKTRIMFVYDKKENRKEFRVLNKEIPKEMAKKITSWLEQNLDPLGSLQAIGCDEN